MTDTPRQTPRPGPAGAGQRLDRVRMASFGLLTLERLWPRLLPLVCVAALFVSASWFGLFRSVGDAARMAAGMVFLAAFIVSLFPLRGFRLPRRDEVDRRLERDNRLAHEPITVQGERLAEGTADPFAAALWREHQRRMAARIRDVDAARPRTGVPARDPYALRAVVAGLFVIAFAWQFGPGGGRLGDLFTGPPSEPAPPPRIDAWVTPPAYTGQAPVFLTAAANSSRDSYTVPQGSTAIVRIIGGSGAETVSFGGNAVASPGAAGPEPATDARNAGRRFDFPLAGDGELVITDGAATLGSWRFSVTPDRAPTIALKGRPSRAVNGALTLTYTVDDDHGASAAEGKLSLLDQAPGARPLYEAPELPLGLPRRGAGPAEQSTTRDLTEHAWAGAETELVLEARDDAGQTGRSEPVTVRLPERPFANPLARALVEQRRNLALDANRAFDVRTVLDMLTLHPEATIKNASHFLGLTVAMEKLDSARGDDDLRAVADYLWEMALQIESGNLTAAQQRLQAAQEALRQALENGASDEEIERLMAELRDAMQEYLREFAENAMRNQDLAQQMPQQDMQNMERRDLDRMLDQIEEMAKSGARDKAQELLSELQDMMNNLQMGQQQQQGQQGGEQSAAQQQLNELGEILREQQRLMNETFRQNQGREGEQGEGEQQGQQGQQGGEQPGAQQGQQGQQGQGMGQLQQGQQGLRDRLGRFMDAMRGMGMEPGDQFGEAGRSMGNAGEALGQGNGDQALADQGRALEQLRQGAQQMMQQMQQAQGQGDGGDQMGNRSGELQRDPLGRPRATTGPDFGESVKVPDEIDAQRARRILEAIRKRLGESLSPQLEREYLERLLELQ